VCSTQGSSAPIQRRVPALESCQRRRNAAKIQRSGRSSQVDEESFDGASLVHQVKSGSCKRCCGGRIYSPSERGRRGGEGGMLGGGYGGVGGGGDGGEAFW